MKKGSPSYIVQTPHGYHFRLRVPDDLRKRLGNRNELRYSSKTANLSEAKEKARLLAGQIQRLFRQLRRKGSYMASELSEKQIQEIIKGYVNNALEEDEKDRVLGKRLTPDKLDENLSTYDYLLSDFREALALRDTRPVKKFVNTMLEEMNIEIDEDSPSYRKLCRGLLKAQVDVLEKLKKRELGDYSGELDKGIKPQESIEATPSISLEQLVEDYFNECLRAGKWSPRTEKEYRNSYRLLKEFLGSNTPVNRISHQDMHEEPDCILPQEM